MMLMKGRNRISINRATLNTIVSNWFNYHTVDDINTVVKLEFSGLDDNMFTFAIEEAENEDKGNS